MKKNLRSFCLLVMALIIALSSSISAIPVKAQVVSPLTPPLVTVPPGGGSGGHFFQWAIDCYITDPSRWQGNQFICNLHVGVGYASEIRADGDYDIICNVDGTIPRNVTKGELVDFRNGHLDCEIPSIKDIATTYLHYPNPINDNQDFRDTFGSSNLNFLVTVEADGSGPIFQHNSMKLEKSLLNKYTAWVYADDNHLTTSTGDTIYEATSYSYTASSPTQTNLTFGLKSEEVIWDDQSFPREAYNFGWQMNATKLTIGQGSDGEDFDGRIGNVILDPRGGQGSGTMSTPPAPGILYVNHDAIGANNGISWANAYTDLQDALTAAQAGDEIWVAAGTYKPTAGTDRTATFQLKEGVAVYGGFVGTETARDQRNPDPATNLTMLSGDLNEDDNSNVKYDEPTRADNSIHVVTGKTGATVDGFTITAGNANADGHACYTTSVMCNNESGGSGMFNASSNPTVMNVIFSKNSGVYGGGMLNTSSDSTIPPVPGSGSSPALTNVTFSDNTAHGGGGILNWNSNPTLTNVTFSNNLGGHGGGMYNTGSIPILTNVVFSGNSAMIGGGMSNFSSSPILTNVTFTNNLAGYEGGGMSSWFSSSPILTNVTFIGNSAVYGGGMSNWETLSTAINSISPVLTNVTFSSNSATYSGGGMFNQYNTNSILTNVTFSRNSAACVGGMSNADMSLSGGVQIRNTIFWGNTANNTDCDETQISIDTPSRAAITYSNIQDSGGSGLGWDSALGIDGGFNIDSDPLFLDASIGDLHLLPYSPAINAGDNSLITTATDLDGNPRIFDITVDMGAYESTYERTFGVIYGKAIYASQEVAGIDVALYRQSQSGAWYAVDSTHTDSWGTYYKFEAHV